MPPVIPPPPPYSRRRSWRTAPAQSPRSTAAIPTSAGRRRPQAEEQVVENFPDATRQSPHQQATKKGGSVLHELVELYQAKNYPETLTKADALLATTDNAYERSFASQIAANAAAPNPATTRRR